ncbi:MAG TPA: PKD domain-containing protein [Archangium sp.]|nr:PKD domain-containing protein [Archangium sp.]
MKRCIAAVLVLILLAPVAAHSATSKEVTFEGVELLDGTGAASCDDDGVLDTGETARVRVTLRNSGTERLKLTNMTLSSTDPEVTLPKEPTVYFLPVEPGRSASAELPVTLSGPATPGDISLRIDYRDDEQTVPGDKTHTVTYRVNLDERPGTSTLETVESARHPWTVTVPPAGLSAWTRASDPAGAWFFRGPGNKETSDLSLVSPPLQVSATEAFRVIFQQRYAFEASPAGVYYDGAVIELSQDDGTSWVRIGGDSLSPPYNATIDPGGNNPLRTEKAYGGQSPGYPAFSKATLNLGTTYAGKTVRLRFRIGTDSSRGATGWDLDDLQVEGVVNTPFTTREPHRGECTNRAPVANAGPDKPVDEGRLVTLSGSGTDPEGAPLTYQWTQTQGPSVTLSDAKAATPTFLAPEVTGPTDLEFELRVSDGVKTSAPDGVLVQVRDLSPVATVKPVAAVDEGTKVTLEGSASSANGAAVFTYTWKQLDGPPVALSGGNSATASFTAPEVDANTDMNFQLIVSDGELESAPAKVTVRVRNVPNKAPVARAGQDQEVLEGSGVTLNGSESKDPEGSELTYQWTQVGGAPVNLMLAGPRAMFNAPEVDEETVLTFKLEVTEARGQTSEDTVSVRVLNRPPSSPPAKGCAAGPDGGVPMTALLMLSALGFAVRNRASNRRR